MRVIIPPNFNDNGRILGGFVKKQNAVEAGIFAALMYVIIKAVYSATSSIPVVALLVLITAAIGIFLLIGLDDQSLFTIARDQIRYNRRKTVVTLMNPASKEHR